MRIKLDENLPESLARNLCRLGHDVPTVDAQDMVGVESFLITQHKRFMDARRVVVPGSSGAMLVRTMDDDAAWVFARFVEVSRGEPVETWAGYGVTLLMAKLRVTRELPQARSKRRKDNG